MQTLPLPKEVENHTMVRFICNGSLGSRFVNLYVKGKKKIHQQIRSKFSQFKICLAASDNVSYIINYQQTTDSKFEFYGISRCYWIVKPFK